MKKLFLTDLDGTLLNDDKVVTPATRNALEAFVAAGNVFAICTGRPTGNARLIQKDYGLQFPGSFVIGFNGAEIYDSTHDRVIHRCALPKETAAKIMATAASLGVHTHTYLDRYLVSSAYTEALAFYRKTGPYPILLTDDILSELTIDPCKVIAVELHDKEKLEDLRRILEERYGDRLTLMYSSDFFLEIFPREAGKGSALVQLADYLSLPRACTMAAGDQENDISMLTAAGLGIAMCNGTPQVIAAGDVVTKEDNNHDGLVPFLL